MLLTYTDVLVLRQFRPPEEVAHYYAAAKTLALVDVHSLLGVGGGRAPLRRPSRRRRSRGACGAAASTVRWTFWPSLLTIALMLAFGKPILWLFGPNFDAGYPLMFILAIALIARAAVGPAERLLNMLGEQRRCAAVYAIVFALNLGRMHRGGRPLRQRGRRHRDLGDLRRRIGAAVPDRQAPARPAHAGLAAGERAV